MNTSKELNAKPKKITSELKKLLKIFNENQLNSLVIGEIQIHRHQPLVRQTQASVGTSEEIDVIAEMDKEIEEKLRRVEQ